MNKFQSGENVLLIATEKKRWLVTIENREFHTNFGKVNLEDLLECAPGDRIVTSKGKKLIVVYPNLSDWIRNIKHGSQIIYEKDAAMISFLVNASPGAIIYEAGTGSGALTSILANSVGPTGKIVTHDVRNVAVKTARANIQKMGLTNVVFNTIDVREGFSPGIADGLVLDLVDPWNVIAKTTEVLKPGGMIVIFQPTYNQLEKTYSELLAHRFIDIKTLELLEREVEVKDGAVRPATRMIGHTGFLIHARYVGRI